MEIMYHGHSCIQIFTGGKSLIIDPFLRGNELAITLPEEIKTDAVLLTHAHIDHILDAEPIAKANDIPVVANVELATYMSWKGVKTIDMNIGGTVDLGFAKAKMIQAFHSSGIVLEEEQRIMYAGMPGGYIISAEGLTILHAGDTSLFGDMKMFGDRYSIDIAFVPIGDKYTMGIDDALQAAEWYNAKMTVPVHYNTFPLIQQDAQAFVQQLERKGLAGKVLQPGEVIDMERTNK
ncbi:metal-dependent hydrolase [Paenibacillus sp. IHBB 10380]|uniref:metal-dependent hydrolase n=1 Tax=Paenibacillus sp. IHBB 10380 TaxID=1566358 RepID=UPI0005CFB21D|nr:metal-dependent hydrolase [Paenibacillus sp. IHBB 10380]AJS60173.1 metal-dependent hydrolase [Paenibacillus sp. IHBB 10380]